MLWRFFVFFAMKSFLITLKSPTSYDDHVFDVTFFFKFFCIYFFVNVNSYKKLYLPNGKANWLTIKEQHGYNMLSYWTRNQALTLFLTFIIFSLIRDEEKNRTQNIFFSTCSYHLTNRNPIHCNRLLHTLHLLFCC